MAISGAVDRLIRSLGAALPGGRRPYDAQFAPAMDLPRFDGRPRFWLLATTPRCGSHFLGHAIAEGRFFGVPLEYLNPGNMAAWQRRFHTRDPRALFGELARNRSGPTGWFAVKAHWKQFRPWEDTPLFCGDFSFERAVWLRRRDLLGQAISHLRAQQTRQWMSGIAARRAPRYDYRRIVANAGAIRAQNAAWAAFFAGRFGRPVLPLVYEDLLAAPASTFMAVAAFLDPPAPSLPAVSSRTERQSDAASDAWRRRFASEVRPADAWILAPQEW